MSTAHVICGFLTNRWSAPSQETLDKLPIPGKTVIVIGASGGLGLEAARHYVRLGASRVILGVRSQSKGEAAKSNITSSFEPEQIKSCTIDVWMIDLASFESVKAFADRATRELASIDITLLNAAVDKAEFELTKDGWEETLQVNVLSTTLLALLLLPKMRQSSRPDWKPRLSVVASRGHQRVPDGEPWQDAPNCLEALNKEENFAGSANRYCVTKLVLIYAVREIAKLALSATGEPDVVVNYSCPGACQSDLAREWTSAGQRIGLALVQATICKTTEEGSRTLVVASGLGPESHGLWYHKNKIAEPGVLVTNEKGKKLQAKIWNEMMQILAPHGVEVNSKH
ncbi:Short chain dehydrogenase yanD [Trichoderma ghanense]|uniref:Short chain dehydrogenase yanD n=1 Tax=Trichoderma ghanense TaxID=65468 RepID=A0ABY2H4D5_9HYPO